MNRQVNVLAFSKSWLLCCVRKKKCLIDWLKTILVKNGGHIKISSEVSAVHKNSSNTFRHILKYSVNHFKSINVKECPNFVELVSNRDTLPREAELTQKCFSNKETDCEEHEIVTFRSTHSVQKIRCSFDRSRPWNAAADFYCSHLCTLLPRIFFKALCFCSAALLTHHPVRSMSYCLFIHPSPVVPSPSLYLFILWIKH